MQSNLVTLDRRCEARTSGELVLDQSAHDPEIVSSGHLHALHGAVRQLEQRGCVVLEQPLTLDELCSAVESFLGPWPVD